MPLIAVVMAYAIAFAIADRPPASIHYYAQRYRHLLHYHSSIHPIIIAAVINTAHHRRHR